MLWGSPYFCRVDNGALTAAGSGRALDGEGGVERVGGGCEVGYDRFPRSARAAEGGAPQARSMCGERRGDLRRLCALDDEPERVLLAGLENDGRAEAHHRVEALKVGPLLDAAARSRCRGAVHRVPDLTGHQAGVGGPVRRAEGCRADLLPPWRDQRDEMQVD